MKDFFAKLCQGIRKFLAALWAENKVLLLPLIAVMAIYGIFFLTGVSCPIKFITGISCPGCGMTRALTHALRLDFAAAFSYHPLWLAVIPAFAAIFTLRALKRERTVKAVIIICCLVMITTYILRMFLDQTGVVVFHPEENIFARAVRWFAGGE